MQINDDIRSQTESFVADVTALISRSALDAVRSALTGSRGATATVKAFALAKKAAPAKAAAPVKKAGKTVAAPKAAAKRPLGAKRSPDELDALVEKLAGYIQSNPGQRAEAISKALSLPPSEMKLPIKKLLGSNRIRSEGQKRATQYFPV
jgi:hypothetical protein